MDELYSAKGLPLLWYMSGGIFSFARLSDVVSPSKTQIKTVSKWSAASDYTFWGIVVNAILAKNNRISFCPSVYITRATKQWPENDSSSKTQFSLERLAAQENVP